MKHADLKKLEAAGLITPEQRQRIIDHFHLKEDTNRFLAIISFLGAVLIASGIILLIAANWDEIPRGMKIAAGIALMLGAHAGGWYLREIRGDYKIAGEALHLVGAGLFLGNIGLIGQIYHLSSRAPNAILLWFVGIAAFPWLLRSKAQHLLTLLAFGLWFGMEINEADSWIYFGDGPWMLLLFSLLGLVYLAFGHLLRETRFADFSGVTEKLGLLGFLAFFFPLTWEILYRPMNHGTPLCPWILPLMSGLAVLGIALGLRKLEGFTTQWRWTWGLTLAGAVGLLACAHYWSPGSWGAFYDPSTAYSHKFYAWICSAALFVLCLVQVQVGLNRRQEYMVNLGVAFIALDIFVTYLNLFGSLARTGLMFVISGVFLIAFGIYLEKKRRSLLKRMNAASDSPFDSITLAKASTQAIEI